MAKNETEIIINSDDCLASRGMMDHLENAAVSCDSHVYQDQLTHTNFPSECRVELDDVDLGPVKIEHELGTETIENLEIHREEQEYELRV